MVALHPAFLSLLLAVSVIANVINVKREPPQPWESLAGRSQEEIEDFIKRNGNKIVGAQPLPIPMKDTRMKLVHDAKHPYKAPRPGVDTRGPCPGMNTLANHGYYSRTGVDTPQNLIIGSQEGFNMGWDLASFVTIYSHVLFGNVLTNQLSIGEHHPSAGPLMPQFPNAVMNGLATHGDFEGDSSQSRLDAAMGDPLAFNEDVFNLFLKACDAFGGVYNATSASFMRYSRYEHSKSINPDFHFQVPRYMTAYGETTFPLAYWQDGRELKKGKPLTCRSMRIFYEQMKMPKDFWRRDGKFGLFDVGPVVNEMRSTHQLEAGHNEGVGNWVKASDADQALLDANGPCAIYKYACHKVTTFLYPNATGILRKALQDNFVHMWTTLTTQGIPDTCSQVFPYEQPC